MRVCHTCGHMSACWSMIKAGRAVAWTRRRFVSTRRAVGRRGGGSCRPGGRSGGATGVCVGEEGVRAGEERGRATRRRFVSARRAVGRREGSSCRPGGRSRRRVEGTRGGKHGRGTPDGERGARWSITGTEAQAPRHEPRPRAREPPPRREARIPEATNAIPVQTSSIRGAPITLRAQESRVPLPTVADRAPSLPVPPSPRRPAPPPSRNRVPPPCALDEARSVVVHTKQIRPSSARTTGPALGPVREGEG